jgi:hypothetical protein
LSPRRIPVRIPVEVGVPGGLSPRRIPSPGPSITGVVAIVPINCTTASAGAGAAWDGRQKIPVEAPEMPGAISINGTESLAN